MWRGKMDQEVRVVEQTPSVEDYMRLRFAVGWTDPLDLDAVKTGLQKSLFSVCAIQDNHVVGYGRVIGDGCIYFYVQDIMVEPSFQNKKIGSQIMDATMKWIEDNAFENSFIGLMAAKGAAPFYYKYGFQEREADRPGMFMRFSTKSSQEFIVRRAATKSK
jgi:GNAT superfamily N-acetyltransferase